MPSSTALFTPPWTAIRSQFRAIFADRPEDRELERELADYYASEKDLTEIGAILDRYTDAQSGDIRRILGAQSSSAR